MGCTKASIYRHEHVGALPPLLAALRYEILFLTPVSTLFAGMLEAVEDEVEERLEQLEDELQRGRHARKQTLDWITERRTVLLCRQ